MSYPETQDNFVPLVDGDDDVEAINCNELQTAIEALQAFLGVSGAGQAHNTDIIAHLMEELPTIRLSYVDADTVQASTGISKPRKSDLSIRKFRKNTSTTNITGANLDTGAGSFANSTDYYVFAIGDASATTVTFKVTTSATTPASSTSYELLGGFSTDGSGDVVEKSVWSAAGIKLLQSKRYETGAYLDCANATPYPLDNTSPSNTQGDQVMTDWFKPSKSTSRIRITVEVNGGFDGTNTGVFWLLLDSDTSARKLGVMTGVPSQPHSTGRFVYEYKPGSVNRITAYVRAGQPSTGYHFYFNGWSGAAKGNGKYLSSITFEEFEN